MKPKMLWGLLAAVLAFGHANAADQRPVQKAPAYTAPAGPLDLSGFYLGANVGWTWNKFDATNVGISDTPNGATVGLETGYRWQSNRWLLGVVADINAGDISGSKNIISVINVDTQAQLYGSVRGELGYVFEGFAPYLTVGWGWERGKVSVLGFSDTVTHSGVVYGGGVVSPLTKNLFLKAEYLRYDFGGENYTFFPGGSTKIDSTIDVAKIGLQYRF